MEKDLEDTDVYDIVPSFSSKNLGDQIEDQWQKNLKKDKKTSLLCLLVTCFGKGYLFWGVVQLSVKTALIFIQPTALGKFVAYFQPGSEITRSEFCQYASLVIGLNLLSTIYNHNYQQMITEIGMRVRTAVAALIYRKVLRLGPVTISEVTMGKIVTLITKDIFAFENALIFVNDMWIGLIQICLISYLIFARIGWSVLAGVGFYLAIIPLQLFVGRASSFRRMNSAKKTDERLQLTTEALSVVKIIKMYTWEGFFESKLNYIRKLELEKLASVYYLKCIVLIIGGLATNISFFLLIMTYIWTGHFATAEIVYYIQSTFQIMKSYITVSIPFGIVQCSEVYAALKRLKDFLDREELGKREQANIIKNPRVFMKNASVRIMDNEVLQDVSLSIEKGIFLITGNVGSGKSSILKTILGDYPLTRGQLLVQGTISYASQESWLFPSTIKQNIIFGQEYDERRYHEVLSVCALKQDLNQFERGDQTIVGDRGVNLSKGQQARINLARAVYKNSDIYLIDDCLSALDSHVNMYVFKKCVMEFLKDKIVILVTHNINHIKFVYGHNTLFVQNGTTLSLEKQKETLDKRITYYIDDVDFNHFEGESNIELDDLVEADETTELLVKTNQEDNRNLYHEEKEVGKVKIGVYFKYYKFAGGFLILILVSCVFMCAQFAMSFSEKLVSKWVNTETNLTALVTTNLSDTTEYDSTLSTRNKILQLYCGMIALGTVLTFMRVYFNFFFSIKASRNMHKAMTASVLHSVMTFFDTHFIGNIINRFSKDMNQVDETIPIVIYEVFRCTYNFLGIVILMGSVNVMFLIPAAMLVVILYFARRYYLPTGRSVKRLEVATRSPMIGYMNATLEGLTTIRASDKQFLLRNEFDRHQDLFTSTSYMLLCSNRAFVFWLDVCSSVFLAAVVLKFVFAGEDTQAGDVGLAIIQATMLTGFLQWTVKQYSELENSMTSVERIIEYTNVKTENKKAGQIIENWPTNGRIEYKDVSLTYASTKQQVLRNINFVIKEKEKVGIVGRTGAGKSSIISTLFRLYDIEGKILIDGVDTKTISLDFFRSQIAIIPQDPILFSGYKREIRNIDCKYQWDHSYLPMVTAFRAQVVDVWSDFILYYKIEYRPIRETLRCRNMGGNRKMKLKNFFSNLDETISENGSNFSSGQRQLICLSRALMSKNKIIVLDEATSSMDPETCALLQLAIAKNFTNCTVITIAHKLNTVLDSDKVMVVDGGEILEYDKPRILLENKTSVFYRMVKHSGLLES